MVDTRNTWARSTSLKTVVTPDGTEVVRALKSDGTVVGILTGSLADADVAAGIAAHVALGDPHTQYLTEAAAAAGYQPLDADLTTLGAGGASARTFLGLGTGDSPQFTAINLGHASDTTIERAGAGRVTVEGNPLIRALGALYVDERGAVGDGVYRTNGVATSGDATFTCATASWASADISKPIVVAGAGAAGATLATTIASINSTTSVELTAAPSTSVASAKFYYGTDDTAVIQAALDATTDGQGVVFGPGKIYMVSSLKLPGGTGSFGFKRKFFGCHGGMAELVATTSGDYLVAAKRWVTGDVNGAFSEAPFHVAGMVFEAFGLKALGCVHKFYGSMFEFCEFRNATTGANWRITRQNQDGSAGASSYLSGTKVSHCLSVTTLAGVTVAKGFHVQGTAADEGDSATDGTFFDCEAFASAGSMTHAFYAGNTGGWTYNSNRTFACATGIEIFQCGKNAAWGMNNWDSNNGVAARVGKVGTYIDFAALFQGDTFYTDLWFDGTNDATTEVAIIDGAYFWFDTNETTSGILSDGQARIVHNNNRASKIIRVKNCIFQADSPFQRNTGNTLGVFDVSGCYSVEDATNFDEQYLDSGATGVVRRSFHDSASPAASDVLRRDEFYGRDSGGNATQYAVAEAIITDPADGSEDGGWQVRAMVAGALTNRLRTDDRGSWFGASTAIGNPAVGASAINVSGLLFADSGSSWARYSNNANGLDLSFYKSRGAAVGTHTVVSSGDVIARLIGYAADGSTARPASQIEFVVDGTPGSSDMPGRIVFSATADGAATVTEALRISQNGALSHRANATIVIDASSHLGLRSYTVGTLPSASTAARMIYVSDGTSNKRQAVADGTNWRWPDGAVVS